MKRCNYYTVKGREEIIKEENDWYNAEETDKERANDKREVDRLRKDLKYYGSHLYTCDTIQVSSLISGDECSCGFEQALKH